MLFLISQIVVVLIILGLLYLLTWFLPTDSPWAPWWSTNTEVSQAIMRLAKITKKDTFYELGSGTGTTVNIMAKDCGAKCIGIESDRSRVLWSNVKTKIMKQEQNVTILHKSFFAVDLSPATVVYLYLVPRVIKKLQPKLLKELQPGTKIVSHVYEIDYLPRKAIDKVNQLYLYTIPAKRTKKR
jgi:precorrin-6B methylase 2